MRLRIAHGPLLRIKINLLPPWDHDIHTHPSVTCHKRRGSPRRTSITPDLCDGTVRRGSSRQIPAQPARRDGFPMQGREGRVINDEGKRTRHRREENNS